MPTYDYLCKQCGNRFEKFQGINDQPLHECPKCGGPTERLFSAEGGFVLRGKGFYATDYGRQTSDTCCSRGESCDSPKRCCEH